MSPRCSGVATSRRREGHPELMLGVLAVAICVWRIRYFHEPLENDLTIRMAYAARGAAGARYYTDLLVFGPAGTLWINEIFYQLFGASELAMYMMGCTVLRADELLGVYHCARLLTNVQGGLVAAVTWTLVCADLFTQANQPNSEVFINAALVWAFAFVLRSAPGTVAFQPDHGRLAVLRCVVDQALHCRHAAPRRPLRGVAAVARKRGHRPETRSGGIACLGDYAAPALAAWAVLLGWYAATGRLPAVLDASGPRSPTPPNNRVFWTVWLPGSSRSGFCLHLSCHSLVCMHACWRQSSAVSPGARTRVGA